LKTVSEILALSIQFLQNHHIERPRRVAEELLAHASGLKRMDIYMQFDRPLIEEEIERMRAYLKRAITKEPVAYIVGSVDFFGCRIEVSANVLIPRPETEILVDMAVQTIGARPAEGQTLWDLCTGSGCIGLGIKRTCPQLNVVLSDICPAAIAAARRNAVNNDLQIEYRIGDLLSPFSGEKADFVICNPPYISSGEWQKLDAGVRDFEPCKALRAGESGLEFYRRLSAELPVFLNPKAQVFLEIGYQQGSEVKKIFSHSAWRRLELLKDWAGHDRFFLLENE
jgi:release factor glutamine methyltransferase